MTPSSALKEALSEKVVPEVCMKLDLLVAFMKAHDLGTPLSHTFQSRGAL